MRDENDDDLNAAERELEAALASLAPTGGGAARVDAVAAAFEAGRRSTTRQLRLWQSAAAAVLLVAVAVQLRSAGHAPAPGPGDFAPIVAVRSTDAALPASSGGDQTVLMLGRRVQERGLDALPPTHVPAVESFSAGDLF